MAGPLKGDRSRTSDATSCYIMASVIQRRALRCSARLAAGQTDKRCICRYHSTAELPHDFLTRWLAQADSYRLLCEPIDIAKYYRHWSTDRCYGCRGACGPIVIIISAGGRSDAQHQLPARAAGSLRDISHAPAVCSPHRSQPTSVSDHASYTSLCPVAMTPRVCPQAGDPVRPRERTIPEAI